MQRKPPPPSLGRNGLMMLSPWATWRRDWKRVRCCIHPQSTRRISRRMRERLRMKGIGIKLSNWPRTFTARFHSEWLLVCVCVCLVYTSLLTIRFTLRPRLPTVGLRIIQPTSPRYAVSSSETCSRMFWQRLARPGVWPRSHRYGRIGSSWPRVRRKQTV